MAFKKKNILSLMLDIKPTDEKGDLNLEKIGFKNVKKITPKIYQRTLPNLSTNKPADFFEEATPSSDYLEYPDVYNSYPRADLNLFKEPLLEESSSEIFIKNQSNRIGELWANWFAGFENIFSQWPWKKLAFSSAGIFLAIILIAVGVNFFQKRIKVNKRFVFQTNLS